MDFSTNEINWSSLELSADHSNSNRFSVDGEIAPTHETPLLKTRITRTNLSPCSTIVDWSMSSLIAIGDEKNIFTYEPVFGIALTKCIFPSTTRGAKYIRIYGTEPHGFNDRITLQFSKRVFRNPNVPQAHYTLIRKSFKHIPITTEFYIRNARRMTFDTLGGCQFPYIKPLQMTIRQYNIHELLIPFDLISSGRWFKLVGAWNGFTADAE